MFFFALLIIDDCYCWKIYQLQIYKIFAMKQVKKFEAQI